MTQQATSVDRSVIRLSMDTGEKDDDGLPQLMRLAFREPRHGELDLMYFSRLHQAVGVHHKRMASLKPRSEDDRDFVRNYDDAMLKVSSTLNELGDTFRRFAEACLVEAGDKPLEDNEQRQKFVHHWFLEKHGMDQDTMNRWFDVSQRLHASLAERAHLGK